MGLLVDFQLEGSIQPLCGGVGRAESPEGGRSVDRGITDRLSSRRPSSHVIPAAALGFERWGWLETRQEGGRAAFGEVFSVVDTEAEGSGMRGSIGKKPSVGGQAPR